MFSRMGSLNMHFKFTWNPYFMIFAFLAPCIADPIWDGCRKKFFKVFAGLGRKHAYFSKRIFLKTHIYEVLQKSWL